MKVATTVPPGDTGHPLIEISVPVDEFIAAEELNTAHVGQRGELVQISALGFQFRQDLVQTVYLMISVSRAQVTR